MIRYKLSCPACKYKALIRQDHLQELEQAVQTIICPVEHCTSQMTVNRRQITGRKTITETPDYQAALDRQKRKRSSRRPVNYVDEADDSDDEYGRPAKRRHMEEEDDEYVPTPEFNPAMRLNSTGVFCPRGLEAKDLKLSPENPTHVITAKIPGERGKSTNKAMDNVPAWKFAFNHGATNAKPYKLGSQDHYEWCHLIGDSLGGRCTKENLVAGHYAVNTHMLAIEEVLSGRTDLAIQVDAVCPIPRVADTVIYRIYKNSTRKLLHTEVIDGHSTGVSRQHYDAVVQRIKKSCG